MSLSDLPAVVPGACGGYLRSRSGREWSDMDLRNGTPFGDLFDALLDLAIAFPIDALPEGGGRKLLPDDGLLEDLREASRRWPGKQIKPLCRLMCAHFPKYRKIRPDTLRKRVVKSLEEEARYAEFEEAQSPPLSNEELIEFIAETLRQLAKQAKARRAKRKIAPIWPPPIAQHAVIRALMERGKN